MRGAALYCGPRPQAAVDGSRGGQEGTGQEEGPRGTPAQRQARR